MQASDFSDVFVSYRRKDVEFTKQLVEALRKEGKECWIDWEDIPPGSEGFTDDIKRGLEGADAFLAILSPDYLDSTYCVDMELGTAIKLQKKLIPIVLKKFDDRPVPHGIGHINWIYFTPHAGHENTFAESFPKVLDALNLDLAHARAHKNFALRALDWDTHKRHTSRLLKGQELDVAEDWLGNAAGKTPEPTELHREYILTGRKFANLQQRRVLAGVSFALIVSVILAIASLIGFQRATAAEAQARVAEAQARRSAEVSSSLALASAALQPGNEEISIALALEATRIENPPIEVLVSLMQAAYPPGKRDVRNISDGWLTVFNADVSPDGQFIAINNALYDVATAAKVREFPDAPKVSVVTQFLPDGKRVILAGDESSEEKSIHAGLFDVETGALLHEFATEFGVGKLWLSADGSKLATANYMTSEDGYTIALAGFIIFDVATGETLHTVETKGSAIALNADLTRWVEVILPESSETSAEATFVRIVVRSVATNEVITTASIAGDSGYNSVDDVAFHPDGTQLAVSVNRAMHVVDAETGAALNAPRVHLSDMLSYSPDGRYLLIGTIFESQIALWDTTSDNPPIILSGHTDFLLAVEFAGSSDLAVSLDGSGTLIKWDLGNGIEEHNFIADSAWLNNAANELITISGLYEDSPNELVHYSLATYEELSRVSLPEDINSDPIFSADFSQFISQVSDENSGSTNHFMLVDTQTGTIVQEITTEQTIPESFYYVMYQFVPGRQQAILLIEESKWDDATQTNMSHMEWLLWDLATGSVQPYAPLNNLSLEAIDSWTFHPDGQWLYITLPITDEDDRTYSVVTRYDFATGEELSRFDPNAGIPEMFIDDDASFISMEYPLESGGAVVTMRDSQTGALQQTLINQFRGAEDLPLLDLQSNRVVIAFASGGGTGGPISPSLAFATGGSESGFYILDIATGEILWDFGDSRYVYPVGFNADNSAFITAGFEVTVTLYRNDTLDSLIAWTCANRYVPTLTEEQKERFHITSTGSVCDA